MRLPSLNLEAFASVARSGSFSKAATELHISQSALSQRVLNLEELLAQKLFTRDPSGARLTEAGETLLRYYRQGESLEADALRDLSFGKGGPQGLRGTLRIGAYSSVLRSLLLPRLAKLLRANPALKFEFFVRELSDLPRVLRSGQADYILMDRVLADRDLESRTIAEEVNVLVESRRSSGRSHVYLDHGPEDDTTLRFFELQAKPALRRAIATADRAYLDDIYGIIDGAALGFGRAVVPEHLLVGRQDLRVVEGFSPLRNPVVLHAYRNTYQSALHSAVLTALTTSSV